MIAIRPILAKAAEKYPQAKQYRDYRKMLEAERANTDAVTVSTAEGAPKRVNGRMATSSAPGLGVALRPEFLRKAAVDVS